VALLLKRCALLTDSSRGGILRMLLIIVLAEGGFMYLCLCKGITDSDVRDAARAGIVMPCQIKAKFGLKDSGCCGRCSKNIQTFVELAKNEHRVLNPVSS
jgi:bacterioferritin-associated ferredoxin